MVTDEKENKGRDERENSNNANVFDFELAQRLGIKMIEDNQVCIQGHRECPEHVSYWKPIFLLSAYCLANNIRQIPANAKNVHLKSKALELT